MTSQAAASQSLTSNRSTLRWLMPILIAAVTFTAFHRSLFNELVNLDDVGTLVDNNNYKGLGPTQLRWMFTTFEMGPYQPLSWLSYAIDHAIWGGKAVGFHLTNILLHVGAAVTFYFLAMRLIRRGMGAAFSDDVLRLGAGAAAMLFAVHPLRVESVAWATERRDVLSGVLYMSTLIAYLRYVEAPESTRVRRYLLTIGLFVLCLLAKSMAVTLPIAMLIVDVYPLGRLGGIAGWRGPLVRRVWAEKLPFFLVSLGFGVVAVVGQRLAGALSGVEQTTPALRVGIAAYAGYFYLIKLILPFRLAPMYEFARPVGPWVPLMVAGGAVLLALSVFAFLLRRRWPGFAAAWVFYLITLAPVSGLVQAGVQVAADRYTYLPMLGFAVLIGGVFAWAIGPGECPTRRGKRTLLIGVGSGIVAAMVALSILQTNRWHDTERIWMRVLEVDPKSNMAHSNLGIYYHIRGQQSVALQHVLIGANGRAQNSDAQLVCARVLRELGRTDEAREYFRRAASVPSPSVESLSEYGMLLARSGDYAGAERYLVETTRLQPEHAEAQATLGLLAVGRGDIGAARMRFDQALGAPTLPAYLCLTISRAWQRLNQPDEARATLRRGLVRFPGNAELERELAVIGVSKP